jgi:hypothetical protein
LINLERDFYINLERDFDINLERDFDIITLRGIFIYIERDFDINLSADGYSFYPCGLNAVQDQLTHHCHPVMVCTVCYSVSVYFGNDP